MQNQITLLSGLAAAVALASAPALAHPGGGGGGFSAGVGGGGGGGFSNSFGSRISAPSMSSASLGRANPGLNADRPGLARPTVGSSLNTVPPLPNYHKQINPNVIMKLHPLVPMTPMTPTAPADRIPDPR